MIRIFIYHSLLNIAKSKMQRKYIFDFCLFNSFISIAQDLVELSNIIIIYSNRYFEETSAPFIHLYLSKHFSFYFESILRGERLRERERDKNAIFSFFYIQICINENIFGSLNCFLQSVL